MASLDDVFKNATENGSILGAVLLGRDTSGTSAQPVSDLLLPLQVNSTTQKRLVVAHLEMDRNL
jgi:hypothetical protein